MRSRDRMVSEFVCVAYIESVLMWFFFSSRRRHTRFDCDWSSDVCSSDLERERWQAGDLMLVDNVRTAHARESFAGPREVFVPMASAVHLAESSPPNEVTRSEERRVGKEGRSRWSPYH